MTMLDWGVKLNGNQTLKLSVALSNLLTITGGSHASHTDEYDTVLSIPCGNDAQSDTLSRMRGNLRPRKRDSVQVLLHSQRRSPLRAFDVLYNFVPHTLATAERVLKRLKESGWVVGIIFGSFVETTEETAKRAT